MNTSAIISNCGQYRYELHRIWDEEKPLVLFIGINPSTADATNDDNTSRICMNYAKRWGYGGLLLGNLFAYRSTKQSAIFSVLDPIGAQNDLSLQKLQSEAALVVCAWGNQGTYKNRDKDVLAFIKNPHCLRKLKSGSPCHPLYKSATLQPVPL